MSANDNHADALAYRYRYVGASPAYLAKLEAMSTAEIVARCDARAAERPGERFPMPWPELSILAARSGIAHTFEADYEADITARYQAVIVANPDLDPNAPGFSAFDQAYGAYCDAHGDVPVPTERALAWAREQIAKEQSA